MKTIKIGEEKFGIDYMIPSKDVIGADRYCEMLAHEERHAKRVLYEKATVVFKNIHAAFLDKYDVTLGHEREIGKLTFRMEYRVRGEVWDG